MKIREIHLRKFMSHDKTDVKLPDNGIVLVTGDNGAGKSSLLEGVAYCLYGKSLRGTPVWRDGVVSKASLVLGDGMKVGRSRKGASTNLTYKKKGQKQFKADTPTKTQVLLEQEIGASFEVWRRSCVFSSSDAANFTLATDSERKRLLERLIGLDHFDPALKKCRADLADARLNLKEHEGKLEGLRNTLTERTERLRDANEALTETLPHEDPEQLQAKVAALATHIAGCQTDVRTGEQALRDRAGLGAEHRARANELERRLLKLNVDECPTCGQTIEQALRDSVAEEIRQATDQIEAAKADHAEETQLIEAQQEELYEELKILQEHHQKLAKQSGVVRAFEERRKRAQKLVEGLEGSLKQLEEEIADLEDFVAGAAAYVYELEATERVLGLKGVRSHILSKILSGLETAANNWLSRIAGSGITLTLKAYKTNKKGTTSDAISMGIAGVGGGHGYKGSSGGERRRVDVALLLALAEISRAARGTSAGTVWFDEVFDALDKKGCARTRDALRELATDRNVVIVTHSEDLINSLQGNLHLHVSQGVVT